MTFAGLAGRRGRPGFSLIELLLVISILGVLAALSAAGVMKVRSVQQSKNTRTLLARLDSRLQVQWSAVADKARRESALPEALAMAGGDSDRAQVLSIKLRQRQAFPVTFAEVLGPAFPAGALAPLPVYQQYLTQAGATAATQPYESSVLLLMALRRGPSGTGVNAEDLGATVKTFTTPGGTPIEGLADAYGNPLVFSRWPTGDAAGVSYLNPGGAAAGFNDTGDPKGLLTKSTWLTTAAGTQFAVLHPLPSAGKSVKLSPTLLSAGPNGKLGVNPITLAFTSAADAGDNLSIPEPR